MILKNGRGMKKEVELLLEVNLNNKNYLIYRDTYTNKVYGGRVDNNILKCLQDSEEEILNNILERINN